MRINPVKRSLLQGHVAFGTMMFEFATPGIGRLAAGAGAEFAIFDMEHTGWTMETIKMLIAGCRVSDLVPIVRVPAGEYHFLARVLDAGAMGVMVPMVETVEQAQHIVRSCKYPPIGRRGAAFGIAHDDYHAGNIQDSMKRANAEVLIIAQIETKAGLEQVNEIAAVGGVDVLWLGQFDLTCSLNIPGQFDHPNFTAAQKRVVAACRSHNKVPAYIATSVGEAQQVLNLGFRMIAYGGDLWIYQAALRDGLTAIRRLAAEGPKP